MELYTDSRPAPDQLPADAVAVLAFDDRQNPPRWRLVGIATELGDASIETALTVAGAQHPDLHGLGVLATPIGGKASTISKVNRTEQTQVHVALERLDAPDPANQPDPGGAPLEPGP